MHQHPNLLSSLLKHLYTIMTIGLLTGCVVNTQPHSTIRHQSGQIAQVARCPVGEYELCLLQLSNACDVMGYTIQEKVRQIKSGVWVDTAETLIVAQCTKSNN